MSDTTPSQRAPNHLAHPEPRDAADSGLALLEDLESNLLASQNALLSGDLARLEELTGEQALFERKLSTVLRPAPASGPAGREVRAAQLRILHLGRVQIALLARRQQGLRILRHRMAGLQSLYSPPACKPDFLMERGRKPAKEA